MLSPRYKRKSPESRINTGFQGFLLPTPTRSLQNNLNSICLRILARSISIICIVSKIQAIKNSVAILLPRYKIIIAEERDKINTLKY